MVYYMIHITWSYIMSVCDRWSVCVRVCVLVGSEVGVQELTINRGSDSGRQQKSAVD